MTHLRLYRFDDGPTLDGSIVGAIERLEAGGTVRVLDALFVRREPGEGELEAVDLRAGSVDGTLSSLLDFRLDSERRRQISDSVLAAGEGAVPAAVIRQIAATLDPGGAVLAVLTEGAAPQELDDVVAADGAVLVADEAVEARALADVAALLVPP